MSLELVQSLVSQVEKRVHGQARADIVGRLDQDPSADTIAGVAYDIIMAIDTQAASRGAPLDIDVLMGVATETIDMLIEIVEAMGGDPEVDEMREESLIKMLLLHMREIEGDPEQVAGAQDLLRQLTGDGTMQMAMNHIGEQANASSEDMLAEGMAMAQPQQNPLAAGVSQGLMNQESML